MLHFKSLLIHFTKQIISVFMCFAVQVPELDSPASTGYIAPKLHCNMELEQTTVLTLVGNYHIGTFYLLLGM